MTYDEFTIRTQHEPKDASEWREITRDYMRYNWEDKDMFCRRWLIGEIIRSRKAARDKALSQADLPLAED